MATINEKSDEQLDLWHKIEGEGKRHFVLIHNAGGDHNFLNEQCLFLSKLGKVLTLDLKGHGASPKSEGDYKFSTLAKEIKQLCDQNGIKNATVVGLNIGANIALELALNSDLVAALVLIEPPILMNRKTIKMIKKELKEFKKSTTEVIAKRVVEHAIFRSSLENQYMAIKAFQESSVFAREKMYEHLLVENWNYLKKLRLLESPILIIQTSFPFTSKQDLVAACPQVLYGQVVGSGPWATVEVPDQVNAMIERFVQFHITSL